MKLILNFVLMVLTLSACYGFPEVRIMSEVSVNHLEPARVPLFNSHLVFRMVLNRSLVSHITGQYAVKTYAKMLTLPSFSPERVVAVHKPHRDDPDRARYDCKITYVVAPTNIYGVCMDYQMQFRKLDYEMDFYDQATKHEKSFPVKLAEKIHQIWKIMILNSRYPVGRFPLARDGVSYEFSCTYIGLSRIHAYSRNIRGELPQQMVDIGLALMEYCEAVDEDAEKKQLASISEMVNKMLEEVEPINPERELKTEE